MIELPGIEVERVIRRIDFLRSRAQAHLELEPEGTHSKSVCSHAVTRFRLFEVLVGPN